MDTCRSGREGRGSGDVAVVTSGGSEVEGRNWKSARRRSAHLLVVEPPLTAAWDLKTGFLAGGGESKRGV